MRAEADWTCRPNAPTGGGPLAQPCIFFMNLYVVKHIWISPKTCYNMLFRAIKIHIYCTFLLELLYVEWLVSDLQLNLDLRSPPFLNSVWKCITRAPFFKFSVKNYGSGAPISKFSLKMYSLVAPISKFSVKIYSSGALFFKFSIKIYGSGGPHFQV